MFELQDWNEMQSKWGDKMKKMNKVVGKVKKAAQYSVLVTTGSNGRHMCILERLSHGNKQCSKELVRVRIIPRWAGHHISVVCGVRVLTNLTASCLSTHTFMWPRNGALFHIVCCLGNCNMIDKWVSRFGGMLTHLLWPMTRLRMPVTATAMGCNSESCCTKYYTE